ncbi:MAG: thiolase family protein [Deltaproteobacteria bacterium]|nr:thiolase family protein [Deltaproteobacteria bacterium]
MEKVVIVEGLRSPYIKAGTDFKNLSAIDLGSAVLRELLERTGLSPDHIDEVIIGNVSQPVDSANPSRVIALRAGLPKEIPAYTVQRNCASGMQAITSACIQILAGESEIVLAGGVESMSQIPFYFTPRLQDIITRFQRARSLPQRLALLSEIRVAHLKPVIGVMLGLTDPVCGKNMGQTAEILARDFAINREEQDRFSLLSHQRAADARERLADEIIPLMPPPGYKPVAADNGIRESQTMEALGKLKPVFDRHYGTVTAGNASQLTDGAAMVLVMTEKRAKDLGYEPLGYIKGFAYAGLDPARMGLGPVFAMEKVFEKTKVKLKDIQLMEINEAFAAQVIACERAFESKDFADRHFGKKRALGKLNRDILNVNGGAIALGHPVGSTGARLVLTLLKEMKRRDLNLGLASLCIGGGQGGAIILERV